MQNIEQHAKEDHIKRLFDLEDVQNIPELKDSSDFGSESGGSDHELGDSDDEIVKEILPACTLYLTDEVCNSLLVLCLLGYWVYRT